MAKFCSGNLGDERVNTSCAWANAVMSGASVVPPRVVCSARTSRPNPDRSTANVRSGEGFVGQSAGRCATLRTVVARPSFERTERVPLARAVKEQANCSWNEARKLCARGLVTVNGEPERRASFEIGRKDAVAILRHTPSPLANSAILYRDADVVVVDKPPGMLSVPWPSKDPDARAVLSQCVHTLLRRLEGKAVPPLRVVQRLDVETSGVMVFARSRLAERHLGLQLRDHSIDREYSALAYGTVCSGTHESYVVPDRGDGLRGSWRGRPPAFAKYCCTHVEQRETWRVAPEHSVGGGDTLTVSLVKCRLKTGRQHQIRIHLSEAGHPLVGEWVYTREYRGGLLRDEAWLPTSQARVLLHAAVLGFVHPRSGETMRFEVPLPPDMEHACAMLRKSDRLETALETASR